jgi:hypothetical protein
MKKLLLLALIVTLSGCTAARSSKRALEAAGYTNIEMKGYAFFGCDDNDRFHDKFTATGPTGVQVSGVVCSGWFKGSTIRLD